MKNQRRVKKVQKSRKEVRKEKRQLKKTNRFSYHNTKNTNSKETLTNKKNQKQFDREGSNESENYDDEEIPSDFSEEEPACVVAKIEPLDKLEKHIARGKEEEKNYYDDLKNNRVKQLQQQNEEETMIINKYGKLLKLNRRKKKNGTISTSKFNDGLEYLLELCTDESIEKMYSAAKEVDKDDSDNDNGEDSKLVTGKTGEKKNKKSIKSTPTMPLVTDPSSDIVSSKKRAEKLKEIEKKYFGDDEDFFNNYNADSCEGSDSEIESDQNQNSSDDCESDASVEAPETTRMTHSQEDKVSKSKIRKLNSKDDNESEISDDCSTDDNSESDPFALSSGDEVPEEVNVKKKPEEWEDIYGRKRDSEGKVIKETSNKYVPPNLRKTLQVSQSDDPKRQERLNSLKRQIKGYVNRLAESNLHRIAIDVENLYGSNARNDVNLSLTEVITGSLISDVLALERLVLEHCLLVATLHANVGSEIGAFFIQVIVEKFNDLYQDIETTNVSNKEIDNLILIICHLYTFRLFKHNLIYELLDKLCEKMSEKRIECTLLVLRSIGFILRKDDPTRLKEFIIKIQKMANEAEGENTKDSRVVFMLDILMAIKNNNVSKIPQYDPSLVEHFRKLLKQFVRAGKYVTTLAITIEDLLNVDERGKWWLVGSAWNGIENKKHESSGLQDNVQDEQRQKIFELAKKQRMNTDAKKNIFYILMTADDYLDAFQKIVSSVKDERTIIAVIIHCCLAEKDYNPYYGVIAQKFCDYNRKFLLAMQFSLWDKIKDINSLSIKQVGHLARILISLIENGQLPVSVLKVIEFNQIEKTMLHFLRQVMLGLLLIEDEKFHKVFERIAPSAKLNSFKDQLRLFMKMFFLKDEKKSLFADDQLIKLKTRIHLADKFLMVQRF